MSVNYQITQPKWGNGLTNFNLMFNALLLHDFPRVACPNGCVQSQQLAYDENVEVHHLQVCVCVCVCVCVIVCVCVCVCTYSIHVYGCITLANRIAVSNFPTTFNVK